MLFVAFMRMREDKMQAAMAQRMQWEYPKGVKLVGEYWLTTNDPKVVSIYEADDYGTLMENAAAWDDMFDMKIFPATTAEDGMKWIKNMMG